MKLGKMAKRRAIYIAKKRKRGDCIKDEDSVNDRTLGKMVRRQKSNIHCNAKKRKRGDCIKDEDNVNDDMKLGKMHGQETSNIHCKKRKRGDRIKDEDSVNNDRTLGKTAKRGARKNSGTR
ncbi:Hypothetical predicted protein [Paramuricea clavata]|uniref:Uncharacterized protein n=1 Tax=Paramuricea clavata TaxID=317549 RepID=A0A6S7FRZ5_PARCT|nr:Hypothetical predicted protein [Paramuricea clavata]